LSLQTRFYCNCGTADGVTRKSEKKSGRGLEKREKKDRLLKKPIRLSKSNVTRIIPKPSAKITKTIRI
jgi:hypothetical protein